MVNGENISGGFLELCEMRGLSGGTDNVASATVYCNNLDRLYAEIIELHIIF